MEGFIKEFLVPGSNWFLLIATTAGGLLLYGRSRARQWGRRWLVAVACLYWTLSLPAVAEWLATGNRQGAQPVADVDGAGVQAVVALANGVNRYKAGDLEFDTLGGESVYTVIESIRLYRRLDSPLLVVSGGVSRPTIYRETEADILRDALLARGVPASRILLEGTSGTTREQAVNVAGILRARGIQRFALVTSAIHMPRALAAFQSLDLHPVPAPSAYGAEEAYRIRSRWRPTTNAWVFGERVVYEGAGRLYYWGRGWLGQN
jgi:uncharacterized SAM-binding protein YcdF (DUF218 family)